jgi:hypothetical protein
MKHIVDPLPVNRWGGRFRDARFARLGCESPEMREGEKAGGRRKLEPRRERKSNQINSNQPKSMKAIIRQEDLLDDFS